MKRAKRCLSVSIALLVLVIVTVDAAAPFKKVSIATTTKSSAAKSSTTTALPPSTKDSNDTNDEDHNDGNANDAAEDHEATNSTTNGDEVKVSRWMPRKNSTSGSSAKGKNSKLTGIPQIDYIWDPNLPRELNGYNLSSYPFYSTVPANEDIHFKCDGLHDGFYASIEHKCQIYHHCVYGIRHDFLCANFTAFDQRTFICHFVSDVDCEGSQKYWNRNDNLYMATTTTSTTTTTTEPPPTQRRKHIRPLRPLRRPSNRRPIDDYYYEDEEYDDDYYEERLNRRRKQRPRHRKPVVEYDEEEYEDEKRSFADEKPRRANRFRDDAESEAEEDYESDNRKGKIKPRAKPATAERRKISNRKPGTVVGRSNSDSFSDERPYAGRKKPTAAAAKDDDEIAPRRTVGRKRLSEKRSTTASPATDFDDLDEYEKPQSHIPDQEEAAADEDALHKVKTTAKPLEEFITPKAMSSSVYARPRAPPRISRPVPINEKSKFKYPVQKSTPAPADADANADYYEDEEYADARPHRSKGKKRVVVDDVSSGSEEEDVPAAPVRKSAAGRKPLRTLKKPVTAEKKTPAAEEEEDYDHYEGRGSNTSRRRNPLTGRTRGRGGSLAKDDDVDFVDDEDYEERPLRRRRPGAKGRRAHKKPRLPEPVEEEEPEYVEPAPKRIRGPALAGRRKPAAQTNSLRSRNAPPKAAALAATEDVAEEESLEEPTAITDEELEDVASSKAASSGAAAAQPTSRPASISAGALLAQRRLRLASPPAETTKVAKE